MEKRLTNLVADRVRMRRWVLGSTVFLALVCLVLEVITVLLATAYWILLCVCLSGVKGENRSAATNAELSDQLASSCCGDTHPPSER